jgi:thymidylate synthase ThyX
MGIEEALQKFQKDEIRFTTGEPVVKLIAWTEKPFDTAIAAARTCYNPRLVLADEITEDHRNRIGHGIYEAGHHTPFQHPTFIFGFENISRQFTWSFLHSHVFYNSEQSSQRYNVLGEAKVFVPPIDGENMKIYKDAILSAWHAYNELAQLLIEDNFKLMSNIGRIKGQTDKQIRTDSEKKSIENARYVIPVAAFTSMYHTISGIELKRYVRMANTGDCPFETRRVVQLMVDEVRKIDPLFFEKINEDPIPVERLAESQVTARGDPDAFARRFDAELGERTSKMVFHDPNAERLVADSVREVYGLSAEQLGDDEAIDVVMNPEKNPCIVDTLNSWTHSPVMRALNHVNYTFKKKLSHTADSQEQRHRTLPASRPLLLRVHTKEPDYILPDIVKKNAEATKIYADTMKTLWGAKNQLVANGVPEEFAVYLLPNATAIRYTQSGSLLNFMHKWRLRTCFNAQMEIYNAAKDELMQASKAHPRLTRFIGPPCFFRKEDETVYKELEGPCPEGVRWCGITVWLNWPNTRRPF